MSYITACPTCETQFLITKAHLKAYRGKVQCGNCKHIFNAKNRLTEIADEAYDDTDYPIAASEDADSLSSHEPASDEHIIADTASVTFNDEEPISQKLNVVLDSVPNLSDLASTSIASSEPTSAEAVHSPHLTDKAPSTLSEQEIDIDAIRAPILIEDLTADPKFQLTKPKRSVWLWPAIGLLCVLALFQSIYFMRTQIAANYPQFKPFLVQACQLLHCKIELPKQLHLLTIDDSDMLESEEHQNVIHFSSLLINNANYAQAYPIIELSLTDAQDTPVLRKRVKPQEYLQANTDISAGIAAHAEERIKLAIDVQNLPVAGYRVLLAY